jgi:hypothetical protein
MRCDQADRTARFFLREQSIWKLISAIWPLMLPRSCRWSDVASGPGGHPTASGITDAPLEIRGRANLVGQLDAALPFRSR